MHKRFFILVPLLLLLLIAQFFQFLQPDVINNYMYPDQYKKDLPMSETVFNTFEYTLQGDAMYRSIQKAGEQYIEFYDSNLNLIRKIKYNETYDQFFYINAEIVFGFKEIGQDLILYSNNGFSPHGINLSAFMELREAYLFPEKIVDITQMRLYDWVYTDRVEMFFTTSIHIANGSVYRAFFVLYYEINGKFDSEFFEFLENDQSANYLVSQIRNKSVILREEYFSFRFTKVRFLNYTKGSLEIISPTSKYPFPNEELLHIVYSNNREYYIVQENSPTNSIYTFYDYLDTKIGSYTSQRKLSFNIQRAIVTQENYLMIPKYAGTTFVPITPIEVDGNWIFGFRLSNKVELAKLSTSYIGLTEMNSDLKSVDTVISPNSQITMYFFNRVSSIRAVSLFTSGNIQIQDSEYLSLSLLLLDMLIVPLFLFYRQKEKVVPNLELFPTEDS